MRPFNERTPDTQYQDALRRIYEQGDKIMPIQGEETYEIVGGSIQLHYDLENGFPVITERDFSDRFFKAAIAEHIAFLNGARTQKELEEFGCKWWSRWLTEEKCSTFGLETGDLGPGSYGAGWTAFPTSEGKPFDQIQHVIRQIKERPYLRTHRITPWIPQYTIQHSDLTRKVVVAPCHGDIFVKARPESKELEITHIQRSGDFPVGVPFNIIQYAAFGLMLEKITGYKLKKLHYIFVDAHIYASQFESVEELLNREPRRLPTVTLDANKDNIKDYRPEDFTLSDYEPHPAMTIPTPV